MGGGARMAEKMKRLDGKSFFDILENAAKDVGKDGGEGVEESQDGREDQVEEEQGGHRPGRPVVWPPCVDAAGDEPGIGQNTMR